MGYFGMCGPKGHGFSAVFIDRVSILANFGHFGHKYGRVYSKKSLFHHYRKENQQKPFTFMFKVWSELRNLLPGGYSLIWAI